MVAGLILIAAGKLIASYRVYSLKRRGTIAAARKK